MKNFFASFNFARALILLCLLGSMPLGWYGWEQFEVNSQLKSDLAAGGRIETLIMDIQSNAHIYSTKKEEQDAEGLAGESNPQTYIRTVARMEQIDLGQVDIDPSTQPRSKGIVDKIYRITPGQQAALVPPHGPSELPLQARAGQSAGAGDGDQDGDRGQP